VTFADLHAAASDLIRSTEAALADGRPLPDPGFAAIYTRLRRAPPPAGETAAEAVIATAVTLLVTRMARELDDGEREG
jgi:hypothetical protein